MKTSSIAVAIIAIMVLSGCTATQQGYQQIPYPQQGYQTPQQTQYPQQGYQTQQQYMPAPVNYAAITVAKPFTLVKDSKHEKLIRTGNDIASMIDANTVKIYGRVGNEAERKSAQDAMMAAGFRTSDVRTLSASTKNGKGTFTFIEFERIPQQVAVQQPMQQPQVQAPQGMQPQGYTTPSGQPIYIQMNNERSWTDRGIDFVTNIAGSALSGFIQGKIISKMY